MIEGFIGCMLTNLDREEPLKLSMETFLDTLQGIDHLDASYLTNGNGTWRNDFEVLRFLIHTKQEPSEDNHELLLEYLTGDSAERRSFIEMAELDIQVVPLSVAVLRSILQAFSKLKHLHFTLNDTITDNVTLRAKLATEQETMLRNFATDLTNLVTLQFTCKEATWCIPTGLVISILGDGLPHLRTLAIPAFSSLQPEPKRPAENPFAEAFANNHLTPRYPNIIHFTLCLHEHGHVVSPINLNRVIFKLLPHYCDVEFTYDSRFQWGSKNDELAILNAEECNIARKLMLEGLEAIKLGRPKGWRHLGKAV